MTISIPQECLTELKRRLLQKSMSLNKGLEFEDKLASGLLGFLFEISGLERTSAKAVALILSSILVGLISSYLCHFYAKHNYNITEFEVQKL